jgi:hypothetical protein
MHLTFMHRHGIILYLLNFPKYWILRFVHCQTVLFKGLQGNNFLFYLSLVLALFNSPSGQNYFIFHQIWMIYKQLTDKHIYYILVINKIETCFPVDLWTKQFDNEQTLEFNKSSIFGGKWNNFVLRGNWIMPKKNDKLSDNLF